MHPSRSCGAISRFILAGVEIGYPDAVEIHRRRAKRQDILNTLGRKIQRDIGYRECLRFCREFFDKSKICFIFEKIRNVSFFLFIVISVNIDEIIYCKVVRVGTEGSILSFR